MIISIIWQLTLYFPHTWFEYAIAPSRSTPSPHFPLKLLRIFQINCIFKKKKSILLKIVIIILVITMYLLFSAYVICTDRMLAPWRSTCHQASVSFPTVCVHFVSTWPPSPSLASSGLLQKCARELMLACLPRARLT